MVNIPLVKGFKATNRTNAFILNSLRAAVVIVLTIAAKDYFDKYVKIDVKHTDNDGDGEHDDHTVIIRQTNIKSLLISFLVAFSVSMIAFTTLYVVFGFGGGLLTNET
tara:strand:- start:7428 stop:7751 length:324 start_codon:yes stop_codon:yes gene_type:complete